MNLFATISSILAEILDLDPADITPETYVIRTLEAESIDLLEIGVAMQHRLDIAVDDDLLFLKNVRMILNRAQHDGADALKALRSAYPHLSEDRLREILSDLPAGPVLRVGDLVAYALAANRAGS
ncbi:MAG: acyl carrier protein [Desulfomicrobium sp.]|nr:acyl carrier protein [Pseudomonadota bacterium]MBV1713189.1 acyl carrier protein [Desulfomicrobium sp.]MBU4571293.1 acyl carrier protein [Pseudomonadota bacterium]MBU4595555.1 acyl carrier protein [Pseudomonadota bacterium]MBV1719997.1 acyl carrier protein [Desulfomicrobium sp.]